MPLDPTTRVLHSNELMREGAPFVEPIYATSIYASSGDPADVPFFYGRYNSPNWMALEGALGRLEDAQAVVFASGQSASLALLLALCEQRKRIVATDAGYFGTRRQMDMLAPFGLEPTYADFSNLDSVRTAIGGGAAAIWAESPTNPYLQVQDLAALAQLAEEAHARLVVDNTTATAALQRPLDFGASASIVSLSKATAGHSDLILGAVSTRDEELLAKLRTWRTVGGAVAGPFEAWVAHRGVRTLPLRIQRSSSTALALALFLERHERVRSVHYPGVGAGRLELARKQMKGGFGPLLSFEIDGQAADAEAVVRASRLIRPATSFGGVESTWERRARWSSENAGKTLIRLSVGLEDPSDLTADIEQALARVAPAV
jgi:cystathionine beta-lyase/cystathionine gamma-synthase